MGVCKEESGIIIFVTMKIFQYFLGKSGTCERSLGDRRRNREGRRGLGDNGYRITMRYRNTKLRARD